MHAELASDGSLPVSTDVGESSHDASFDVDINADTPDNAVDASTCSEKTSTSQQQPNCDATETTDAAALLTAAASAPDLRRSSSSSSTITSRGVGLGLSANIGRRSRSRSGGDDSDRASSELVLQLQKLCKRQRQRSEERSFVRGVERVLTLLRSQPSSTDDGITSATFPGPGLSLMAGEALGSVQEEHESAGEGRRSSVASSSSTFSSFSSMSSSDRLQTSKVTLTLAEIDALLDCIADLFDHRNPSVRALAFEVVQLCLLRFGERLTPALRRKIYLRLETHPPGDFLLQQKALRALTQDGRHLEPFHVELGWFLLRLLEHSDAQRDLLGLIQSILRRSPRALDRDKVIAIVSVISARCDMAWSRNDLDACRRFVAFFHVLAIHDLAFAASTPVCLRSLCCLVNADGHGTWSVMKLLLNGSSGFLVLRGLLQLLEHPTGANSAWVLRGAVFFVGMSCWGSQRVAKFDDIAWSPILLALEQAVHCCRGVVIFEVILSIQRLIKKFGAAHPSATSAADASVKLSSHTGDNTHETDTSSGAGLNNQREKRRLVMEWDVILRMLHILRPWVSMTDEIEFEEDPQRADHAESRRLDTKVHRSAAIHPENDVADRPQPQLSVSIQHTRIPRELLDTLQAVEDLVEQQQFAGDVCAFLNILEEYLPHLSENSMLFLLRQRAEASHPGYHLDWLSTLSAAMRIFFSCVSPDGDSLPVPSTVRLEALEVLRINLWTSRNVCEDRVIEEVVIPTLGRVYEDNDPEVRRRSLDFIVEVARQLESVKFDSLLDILASAMTLSSYEDAQLVAASGIVALFSSAFDHLPPGRAVRMYDLLATTVETHRSRAVRHAALSCLLYVCEARATDGKLQWKEQQHVRTSRFLFVSRRAARTNTTGVHLTAACVPIARALRALLTLVSAEPDAELFRMAVRGIKIMLENRAILEDVDVGEVSVKVVASIDYRAFGRAAIPDEVEKLLHEQTSSEANESALVPQEQKSQEDWRCIGRSIHLTDAELVRSIHASTRSMSTGGGENPEVAFCASLQATAALLAKTRFLAMGIELLQLLVSYEADLHDNAVQELTRCLTGMMKLRLAVAEKDLFASVASAEDSTLSSSASSPNILYHHEEESQLSAAGTYSGTPLGFTSRVLSRFGTSASHGNLFHALSGSVSKASLGSASTRTTTSRPSRKDRARLRGFLRQLFDAEFKLLHTTTTALSLLALLAPESVLMQLDEIFQNLRGCVTTVDGDFRPDAFVAVLELLSTIAPKLSGVSEEIALPARKSIVEALLLGFEYAKSRQLAYLSFRLLCQLVHQSDRKNRMSLAALAMPTLQQCTRRANSLLAEVAVDFLLCYAYSQSPLFPSALSGRQSRNEVGETSTSADNQRSRSWVYRRSLLTITTSSRGDASLVIRRANCTSRWELNGCHDQAINPLPPSLFFYHPLRDGRCESSSSCRQSNGRIQQSTDTPRATNTGATKRSLPAELRPTYPSQLTSPSLTSSTKLSRSQERNSRSRDGRGMKTYRDAVVDNKAQSFQHSPASALPPLPAYDGIGGSPSYYYDNTQMRLQSSQHAAQLDSRNSRQAEGDDGQDGLLGKPVIRAIQEDVEDGGDSAEGQMGFVDNASDRTGDEMAELSLNDSADQPPSLPSLTPRVLHFSDSSASASSGAEAGTTHSVPLLFDDDHQYDPMHLMMQLFDITMENRPQLLSDGPPLKLALNVLDRTPEYETHKIGLLYVRDDKQSSEAAILGNAGGSLRYLRFLRGLGTFTKLEGLPGYSGGLDTTNNSDGKFGLIYKDECAQVMFHVATMMIPERRHSNGSSAVDNFAPMKKKRHIGNDFVHVIFKEYDEDYDIQTLSSQFNDVHIIIQPLNDNEYRTEVHVKPGIPPFGPLYGKQIVSSSIISESVKITCLNANLACQVFHQELVGFALNCEERLKQIKQLGLRLATADEWKLDD
ncbi:Tuberous sclerosis 2 [Phytophthora citrophthora]|uniref:Tuberous sclerosis 2 n=1 Tax=Phytophthora citrophthora TaxID=4793 RepID=A0AAD9GZG8_9STRA|nr:Tuberous sclerosis 2 [Phytophthora citrophthora]